MNFKNESAFTLMELIVVIGIIIFLISLLLPRFSNTTDKANVAVAQSDARLGLIALSAYVSDVSMQANGTISADKAINEINKVLNGNKMGIIMIHQKV